jgi:hypothetical protein
MCAPCKDQTKCANNPPLTDFISMEQVNNINGYMNLACAIACGSRLSDINLNQSPCCVDGISQCSSDHYLPSNCPKECAAKVVPVWETCGQYVVALNDNNGAASANAWKRFGLQCEATLHPTVSNQAARITAETKHALGMDDYEDSTVNVVLGLGVVLVLWVCYCICKPRKTIAPAQSVAMVFFLPKQWRWRQCLAARVSDHAPTEMRMS